MHQPVGLGNFLQPSALLWPAGDSEAQNLSLIHTTGQTPAHMLIWAPVGGTCGQQAPWTRGVTSSGVGGQQLSLNMGEGQTVQVQEKRVFEVIPIHFLGEEGMTGRQNWKLYYILIIELSYVVSDVAKWKWSRSVVSDSLRPRGL